MRKLSDGSGKWGPPDFARSVSHLKDLGFFKWAITEGLLAGCGKSKFTSFVKIISERIRE